MRKRSPKARKQRMCSRKTFYGTEESALIDGGRYGLRAYRCVYCPGWHLTSQMLARKQEDRC